MILNNTSLRHGNAVPVRGGRAQVMTCMRTCARAAVTHCASLARRGKLCGGSVRKAVVVAGVARCEDRARQGTVGMARLTPPPLPAPQDTMTFLNLFSVKVTLCAE
ncbi:hypothetical protein E2C01_040743 [Portunus trituberculatus]|uniref:Uncharacterized protein n=1 Tax=Portunus trituberculatus TaxID=210409 RepID=A0A5B7FP13_PORTR|nr:hypothetical protein [Portunus trituberculatus]